MPPMSPWPKNKLTQSAPLKHTGLDYFGPLYIKLQNWEKKRVWVCLFTCVIERAVHVEIVDDLTQRNSCWDYKDLLQDEEILAKSSQTTQLNSSCQNPQLMMHGRKSSKTHLCNRTPPIKKSIGHLSLNYHHGWRDFMKD